MLRLSYHLNILGKKTSEVCKRKAKVAFQDENFGSLTGFLKKYRLFYKNEMD